MTLNDLIRSILVLGALRFVEELMETKVPLPTFDPHITPFVIMVMMNVNVVGVYS